MRILFLFAVLLLVANSVVAVGESYPIENEQIEFLESDQLNINTDRVTPVVYYSFDSFIIGNVQKVSTGFIMRIDKRIRVPVISDTLLNYKRKEFTTITKYSYKGNQARDKLVIV